MTLQLVVPPAANIITVAQAKQHCRVDHADDDDYLAGLIDACEAQISGSDSWMGRALVTQTWDLYLDAFPAREIKVPLPPLQSVVSISYYDPAGDPQVVASTNYQVDVASQPGWIVPDAGFSWPSTLDAANAVIVRFIAGYGAADDVPEAIRAALKMMVEELYDKRAQAAAIPVAAKHLLGPYRVTWL